MKKIIALFTIICVVAVSGCLGDDEPVMSAKGYGLEITNFTSNLYGLYSGQTTHVTMRIENHGESKVLKDYGLALLIVPGDWDITQDKNQALKKDLNFENSDRGIAMGTDQYTWTIKAPAITPGSKRPDSITGRIYYDYQTVAEGTLWLYPESELGSTQNKLTYKTQRGPIAISMTLVPDPVVVYSSGEMFNLNIDLTNVGGGTVYMPETVDADSYSISDADRNVINLDVNIPGLKVDDDCLEHVEFFGNKASVICDITYDEISVPSAKQSYPVSVKADYGYYKDQTINIEVTGK